MVKVSCRHLQEARGERQIESVSTALTREESEVRLLNEYWEDESDIIYVCPSLDSMTGADFLPNHSPTSDQQNVIECKIV